MGDSVECLTDVQASHIHGSPHIHQTSQLNVEGWWVGQTWFHLFRSMSNTPWKCFSELVSPLPSQGSRWDWPACISLDPPSCLPWRVEWHLLSFLLQKPLPVTTWNAVCFLVILLCNEIKQFIGKSSLFALEIVQHFLIPFGLQEESRLPQHCYKQWEHATKTFLPWPASYGIENNSK